MDSGQCPNCGNRKIILEDGVPVCNACGTRLPNFPLKYIDDEYLDKQEEINKLRKNKFYKPGEGVLTDKEVLKYAPRSRLAMKIRSDHADGFIEKLKVDWDYQLIAVVVMFMVLSLVGLASVASLIVLVLFIYYLKSNGEDSN